MALKLKFRTQFPALVTVASPLTLEKTGLEYDFGLDIDALRESLDPVYAQSGTFQVITAAGDVTVAVTDTLIILNKTVSQVTVVNLPPSLLKIGKVKIVDWKGDSGSYPITVNNSGSEKFNGAQASWAIEGNGASLVFDPIPTGLGYAV